MDGCVNSEVAMNNSYSYTKYIQWFLLCASVAQMLNIISITITVSDRLTLCTIAWHFPWKEMQFYLQVSSTNFDRAMFSRSIFYYITKQLQHVQIYRATEVFTAVQDWHFVVQCSENCRLMRCLIMYLEYNYDDTSWRQQRSSWYMKRWYHNERFPTRICLITMNDFLFQHSEKEDSKLSKLITKSSFQDFQMSPMSFNANSTISSWDISHFKRAYNFK